MRIAICGYGRSGKDTACKWLVENTNLNYTQSTSEAAAEVVFSQLRDKYGYGTAEECWSDRHNHRSEWADIIWDFNNPNKSRLYQQMIDEGEDILNGIRQLDELRACFDLIDLSIWIWRPGYTEHVSSCNVKPGDCDIMIHNDKTTGHLREKLKRLSSCLGILSEVVPA